MTVPSQPKREILAVYDYDTGGVWVVFRARSPDEIETAYPELKAAETRPTWMDDGCYRKIVRNMSFDIDEKPTGWLVDLVARRK